MPKFPHYTGPATPPPPEPPRIVQIAAANVGGYAPIVFALTDDGRVYESRRYGAGWTELPALPSSFCGEDGCTRSPGHYGSHGPGATGPHGAPATREGEGGPR